MMKNAIRRTAATASRPRTSGEVQPWSRVIESATIRGTRPATSAQEIDVADGGRRPHERHRSDHEKDRDDANRQVDVEDPAPAPGVRDVTAGRRTDDRSQAEHATEQPGKTGALGRRKQVA